MCFFLKKKKVKKNRFFSIKKVKPRGRAVDIVEGQSCGLQCTPGYRGDDSTLTCPGTVTTPGVTEATGEGTCIRIIPLRMTSIRQDHGHEKAEKVILFLRDNFQVTYHNTEKELEAHLWICYRSWMKY